MMFPMMRRNVWLVPGFDESFRRLRNELESVFEGVSGHDGGALSAPGAGLPVSVWEDDDHLYVEADLPGVAESDVEVTVHEGLLSIKGERKPVEGRDYLYNGRGFSPVERVLTLPVPVSTEAVEASMTAGVLKVTLPKVSEAKPKKISVQAR
jgi:HSP20 family protein